MIKVLGRNTSSNVQVVLWTLAELGVPYEREDRGHIHGGVDTPEYLAMNPNGLVPVLVDEGVAVFESCAIARYLASRYGDGGPFWPRDPLARAEVDKWAEWAKTTWAPSVMNAIFYPLVRTSPKDRDVDAMARDMTKLLGQADLIEAQLGKGPFICGENFTLADIIAGHILYRYFTVPWERPDLPNLKAYYERLQERPAYVENSMISYESLRAEGA